MVADETKHKQVLLGVVTAPQDPQPMVDVELAIGGGRAADLTAGTASGDQPAAASRRELGGSGAAIVCLAKPFTQRWSAQEWDSAASTAR